MSDDGGYEFLGLGNAVLINSDAGAYRGDLNIALGDIFDGADGSLQLYGQTLEAGYSAPGLEALTDTDCLWRLGGRGADRSSVGAGQKPIIWIRKTGCQRMLTSSMWDSNSAGAGI